MQAYSQHDDIAVVVDLLLEVLRQVSGQLEKPELAEALMTKLRGILDADPNDKAAIRRVLPDLRRLLSEIPASGRNLAIFLDDFHVLSMNVQPEVLNVVYSVCRGNGIFLKLSAIETLTKTWDSLTRSGLQIPLFKRSSLTMT
jgi:hypothetical protein